MYLPSSSISTHITHVSCVPKKNTWYLLEGDFTAPSGNSSICELSLLRKEWALWKMTMKNDSKSLHQRQINARHFFGITFQMIKTRGNEERAFDKLENVWYFLFINESITIDTCHVCQLLSKLIIDNRNYINSSNNRCSKGSIEYSKLLNPLMSHLKAGSLRFLFRSLG